MLTENQGMNGVDYDLLQWTKWFEEHECMLKHDREDGCFCE